MSLISTLISILLQLGIITSDEAQDFQYEDFNTPIEQRIGSGGWDENSRT